MAILNLQTAPPVGLTAVTSSTMSTQSTLPSIIYILTNDTYATVTATGYLTGTKQEGFTYSNNQMALVYTTDEGPVWLKVVITYSGASILSTVISLVQISSPGDVVLPTVANHLMVSTDTLGTLSNLTGTAIQSGSLQAGLSGTAGTLISFPSTAAKGSLIVAGVANTGNTNVTISNVLHGQASVYSIPDVGAATGQFLVKTAALVSGNLAQASGTAGVIVDSGVAASNVQLKGGIKAVRSADIGGAGAGPITITQAGVVATSVIVANIVSSSNAVSIAKVTPGTGGFTVLFDADPGAAAVLNYIVFIAQQ